jgi:adenylate cyclase
MISQYLVRSLRRNVGATRYRVTTRDLRLGSGLVLFTYLAAHLANHALGLVSLNAAEIGLRVVVAVWHSVPGTVLLYGAAVIHLALAIRAVYQRRTLRMPPIEALRIALGFGMPLLLVGHFATARVGYELYGLPSNYHRIVWALWASGGEGRQLALLAPGWLHGCLGLNFAFGHRRLYQRLRPLLLVVALLLPVLAALGFAAMGRELVILGANSSWLETHVSIMDASQQHALARLRFGLLTTYFGVISLAFAGRAVRSLFERTRQALITISYPQGSVRVPRDWTVLEASRSLGIPHRAECGGRARCSTCRVRIIDGAGHCPVPEQDELRTLARIRAAPDVRLACQLRPDADITVVPLRPRYQAEAGPAHDIRTLPRRRVVHARVVRQD